VGEYFRGDSRRVANMQHDAYGEVLAEMFRAALSTYRSAVRVVGIQTQLATDMNIDGFDHRTLQSFHDMIAAQFRMECWDKCLPQIPKLLDRLTDEERILKLWRGYCRDEMDRLFQANPEIPRLILTAAVYPNPDTRGIEAEDMLALAIRNVYPELHAKYDELHDCENGI